MEYLHDDCGDCYVGQHDGRFAYLPWLTADISPVASPDGRLLATACRDGGVLVWDLDKVLSSKAAGFEIPTDLILLPPGYAHTAFRSSDPRRR